jgi:hypothetical protein
MGFKPGISGNPAGRPRGSGVGLREIAQSYGPEMLKLLVAKARKGNIVAMCAVLDRGFGKPEISVDFKMLFERKLTELSEAELIALKERLLALSVTALPAIAHHADEATVGLNVGTEGGDGEYSE